jgi:hypothetical protein
MKTARRPKYIFTASAILKNMPWLFLSGHGAEGQNRTADTGIFSPLLYRLSYLGTNRWAA